MRRTKPFGCPDETPLWKESSPTMDPRQKCPGSKPFITSEAPGTYLQGTRVIADGFGAHEITPGSQFY